MAPSVTLNSHAAIQSPPGPLTNGSNHKISNDPTKRIDSILRDSGTGLIDGNGRKVILKRAGLGGHLNMENFITGYSVMSTNIGQPCSLYLVLKCTNSFSTNSLNTFHIVGCKILCFTGSKLHTGALQLPPLRGRPES